MGRATINGELLNPSEYLAAVEFKGRDVTLTIKQVQKQSLRVARGGEKVKGVIMFEETPKKFVINKVNEGSLVHLYGDKAEGWVGKRVTLYPTTTRLGGDTVPCIRVRETAPAAK